MSRGAQPLGNTSIYGMLNDLIILDVTVHTMYDMIGRTSICDLGMEHLRCSELMKKADDLRGVCVPWIHKCRSANLE